MKTPMDVLTLAALALSSFWMILLAVESYGKVRRSLKGFDKRNQVSIHLAENVRTGEQKWITRINGVTVDGIRAVKIEPVDRVSEKINIVLFIDVDDLMLDGVALDGSEKVSIHR